MKLRAARSAALDWLRQRVAAEPWFLGAYLGGSAAALDPEVELPLDSDLDIFVVGTATEPAFASGKLVHAGVLLDVSALPWPALADLSALLSDYHLAPGLRAGRILADPQGVLGRTQHAVASRFAEEAWVCRRCDHALAVSADRLRPPDPARPWHQRVTTWLFGAGVQAHVPLVATLQNPTVRLRHLRVRAVLRAYGRTDLYEEMLDVLGCAELSPARAARHLAALETTFDAAAAARRSPYRFAGDISPAARPIAIDGSRALIGQGDHREAVFWILATFARCQAILQADAPDTARALAPDMAELLADLGIRSDADLAARTEVARRFLPQVREAAAGIIRANPTILHGREPAGRGSGAPLGHDDGPAH